MEEATLTAHERITGLGSTASRCILVGCSGTAAWHCMLGYECRVIADNAASDHLPCSVARQVVPERCWMVSTAVPRRADAAVPRPVAHASTLEGRWTCACVLICIGHACFSSSKQPAGVLQVWTQEPHYANRNETALTYRPQLLPKVSAWDSVVGCSTLWRRCNGQGGTGAARC